MKKKVIFQLCKVNESYETKSYNGFSLERLNIYYKTFKLKIEDGNLPLHYTSHLFEDKDEASRFAMIYSSNKDILTDLIGNHSVTFEYYWVVPSYVICNE